jgi:uncharacterized repeat protein (TIGR01451 family)
MALRARGHRKNGQDGRKNVTKGRDNVGREAAGRLGRWLAACAFALGCATVQAAPAPGAPIDNRATANGVLGGTAYSVTSNVVTAIASGRDPSAYSATLADNSQVTSRPGAVIDFRHVLTNTGSLPDSYTLTLASIDGSDIIAGFVLYPDANGDGVPDTPNPVAASNAGATASLVTTPTGFVTLAPGASWRFIVRAQVAAFAQPGRVSAVRVGATAASRAVIAPVRDGILLMREFGPADCATITKFLSAERGPAPGGPVTVSLDYKPCGVARSKVVITDLLPAGMRYVPGSGRWSGAAGVALTDAAADDRQGTGPSQVAYDFGASAANTVTATVFNIPADVSGTVSFQVAIDAGLAVDTRLDNVAQAGFFDMAGVRGYTQTSNVASYTVTGRIDLELTGERVATVEPGTTVSFTNVLTNKGDIAETFDITYGASTFPAGTTFALFKGDGVTPLADTDGNGSPDTGVVAPGASYRIVLKATLPTTVVPGAYKVTKTARSAKVPSRSASADDATENVSRRCALVLDPDQQARIGRGQQVTYPHYLTNSGNCSETVRVSLDYLTNNRPGWTATAWIDNRSGAGASMPGVLDATDAEIRQGWTVTLAPGETLRILVVVRGPEDMAADTNITTLVISSSGSGGLTVRDTTMFDGQDGPVQPQNVIRNYIDGAYGAPTIWAVVGGDLWLRADAAACNADPRAIETRTILVAGPDGEREQVTGTETGPDTGIFLAPRLPVRAPPVIAASGAIEGRARDVFTAEILGCGRRIETQVAIRAAVGVVFDSRSNEAVEGARVTLVAAAGGQCSGSPAVVGGDNPVTTRADGQYAFPTIPTAGDYCLVVSAPNGYRFASQVPWTRLPAGRNLHVTAPTRGGSYGSAFALAAGAVVVFDIPVDSAAQDGLFVQKDASRQVVELGEFLDYTVRVRNATGNALARGDVIAVDELPAGFAYVPGSARRDGQVLAEPAPASGPRIVFNLGRMERDAQVVLTYRVRVGAGAMQGDGVNRVHAAYAANGSVTRSNVASAKVEVTGGVFSDKGFILGKVFLDCNANGVQDRGELGVAGIRMVMEDGTFAITDGEGKYSFYGVSNRTHVVKADRMTLPAGGRLAPISQRHLGDGGSRIVDMKSGELHRADFAFSGCDAGLVEQAKERAAVLAKRADELGALANTQLPTERVALSDVKALPASGVVSAQSAAGGPVASGDVPGLGAARPFRAPASASADVRKEAATAAAPMAEIELEKLLPDVDNSLGFIGLADGQALASTQPTIRVKGAAGATFALTVNGKPVADQRVGKRAVLAEKQVQGWEFVGVEMAEGENVIVVSQRDGFGNERGRREVRVRAPGRLAKLEVAGPVAGGIADGRSFAAVKIRLLDAKGLPVTGRTVVTVEATRGTWDTPDLDSLEPGLQAVVEGGEGVFRLQAPTEPGEARVVATVGGLRADARVDFLPELRSLIATGVIEGIINARKLDPRSIVPARGQDGFEQELRHLSRASDDGKRDAGARAAFFLKGKVRGDYLLTAAYDSDKDSRERLFRDIQPDEFYPVYGDAAIRGFDAQSTSRFYVRVDRNKSYLLYGDFTTQGDGISARRLSAYSRSLTGARHHFDNGRVETNVFASRDTTRQVIDELRANGTSGPYELTSAAGRINSEKVEILVRDRNRPALVLSATGQARFYDYEMEPLTGRILFKAPVPSVDQDLNPVSIRVTYEVDQGGEEFWVFGGDAQVKVTENILVGASYAEDRNPADPFKLAGAHAVVRIGANTTIAAEYARTDRGATVGQGDAGRVHVRHDGERLKAEAFVARTDESFDNPGAYLSQGRGESGARTSYKIDEKTSVKAEALRTEDVKTGGVRDGYLASVERQLDNQVKIEGGVRHARESGVAIPPTIAGPGSAGTTPNEVTSVRARVTTPVPGMPNASVYGEVEVDVEDADRKIVAIGGDYALPNKGKVYLRHELISSLTGPYGLNEQQRQNTTVVGLDTEYMKDARVFSEYRIRDAIAGGDAEAAIGLRNLWTLAPGLRLGTTLERVESLSGTGQNENTAVALALEYLANPMWKGSTRLELRDGQSSQSLLHTIGFAARVAKEWTFLGRNTLSLQRARGGERGGGERMLERLQAGLAYRDADTDRVNALARVEHREERDDTQVGVDLKRSTQLVSLHGDYKLNRPFTLSGRYAAKWTSERSNGIASKYRAQLAGGRLTWEFAPKWDISVAASGLFGDGAKARQFGVGIELGYLVATNLWVSAGYNVLGFKEDDLAAGDYTQKGAYVRLRYKFDEAIFGAAGEGAK